MPQLAPPPPPPPPSLWGAFVNGGFEDGPTGWTQSSSGGFELVEGQPGLRLAVLGGYNGARETIGQAITAPANGNLRYYWNMSSSDSTTAPHDYLQVQVYNASTGAFIATLRTLSSVGARNVWTRDTISLAAYAGQTVRIQFTASIDSSLVTSFAIDDVMTG